MQLHRRNIVARAAWIITGAVAAAGLSACTLAEVSYTPRSDPLYQAEPAAFSSPTYYSPQSATYAPQPTYTPSLTPSPSYTPSYSTPSYTPVQPAYAGAQFTQSQVADLTASIALYPDPLLGVMLPAATYPDEILAADNWLQRNPNVDPDVIDSLDLEPPVVALMHYPTVIQLMADHPDWTQALGAAFAYQQGDVLDSIQQWRAVAANSGALVPTPQQQVVRVGPEIEILPATPDLVYVPVYDPAVVFVPGFHRDRDRDYIRFEIGGRSHRWLDDDVDWRSHVVRVPERHDWDRRQLTQRDRDARDRQAREQQAARDQAARDQSAGDRAVRQDPRDRDNRQAGSVRQEAPRVAAPTPDRRTVVQPQAARQSQPLQRDKDVRTARPATPPPAAPVTRAPAPERAPVARAPAPTAPPTAAAKAPFVRNPGKPTIEAPAKVTLPQPDRKVVTVTPPARGPAADRGSAASRQDPRDRGNDRGNDQGNARGRADSR